MIRAQFKVPFAESHRQKLLLCLMLVGLFNDKKKGERERKNLSSPSQKVN